MSSCSSLSISSWQYVDLTAPAPSPAQEEATEPETPSQERLVFTEDQVAARIRLALAEAQDAWRLQAQAEQQQRDLSLSVALERFGQERIRYFKQLEVEVVQLSLAIARKILQREAELDPTLLLGLVRISLDRIGLESRVRLRVPAQALAKWQSALALKDLHNRFEVIGDTDLSGDDCIVDADAGAANFSFSSQLRDIEESFSQLLARRSGNS